MSEGAAPAVPDAGLTSGGGRPARRTGQIRVAHVSTAHDHRDVRIFEKECASLAAAGYEVWWVVPGAPNTVANAIRMRPIRLPEGGSLLMRYLRRLGAVYRTAALLRADIYHLHDPELVPVGLALKWRGARVIYDAHEDAPVEALSLNRARPAKGHLLAGLWWLFTALATRCFDGLIAATPAIAAKLKPGGAVVVHNFPRIERFSAPHAAPVEERDRGRLAYVGNITEIRGIRQMLDALEIVSRRAPCRLRLAGRFGSDELRAEAETHPAWELVDYLGHIPWSRVIDEIHQAGIGLLLLHPTPEYLVSVPTKLFEYMAAGAPVVCSDFPLLRRIVTAADCGCLVDPLDPAAVADAIMALINNPGRAAAQGASGRRSVNNLYSWDVEASELLLLYERISAGLPRAAEGRCQPESGG